jgi:hypothetical protein
MKDELRPMYPSFERFLALRHELDPEHAFTSAFHARVLGS